MPLGDFIRPARSALPRRLAKVLCALALAAYSSTAHAAPAVTEDVPIVGGTAAMAKALHIEPAPEAARFVTELVRVLYATPEGSNATTDTLLARLATHMDVVGRFQKALDLVQPPGRAGIGLAMASDKADRSRLKDFLDLVGLKLREKDKRFTVERTDNKDAAERLRLLADLRIDVRDLAQRLNQGDTVRVDVPTEPIPVPLTAAIWSQAVFRKPTSLSTLFSAILTNRDAALLCHGLAALNDDTLAFLGEHPAILTNLYEHDAATFATFGGALRVKNSRVIVPGGDVGAQAWEAVLDEKASRADRFIHELFSRSEGRVAYLYDTISRLEPAKQAFALGAWIQDATRRADRFKSLVSSADVYVWSPRLRPFRRPSADFAELVMRVRVEADGAPSAPAARLLWARAFDGPDLPDEPAKDLKNLDRDGVIDSAWLAESIAAADLQSRGRRLDQFAFGQRVFGSVTGDGLADVLVAVRAFDRYRMLMLTLERMGVRNPSIYAAAARQAVRLGSLDGTRGFYALAQYQGAVAILARLSKVHSIDSQMAEALMASLAAVRLDHDGRYAGGVTRWIESALRPALADAGTDVDRALVALVSGPRPGAAQPARVVWEDQTYRVDLVAPEIKRVTRVLEKLGSPPVRLALELERIAALFTSDGATLATVQAAAADIKTLAAAGPAESKARAIIPPGVDDLKPAREIIAKDLQELAKISKPQQMKRGARVAESLRELADRSLAESLVALTYAIDIGPAEGATLLGGNVGLRHDFGFTGKVERVRLRTPWEQGEQVFAPGVPWHVSGSLLSLDVTLADLSLRRTVLKRPSAPVVSTNDRDAFVATVAILNPSDLSDAGRDSIVQMIAGGRGRVMGLLADPSALEPLADEIRMDGLRRRAAGWTIAHAADRVPSLFSLSELFYLGGGARLQINLDAWGVAAIASTGCICTKLPTPGAWPMLIGRPNVGLLATQVADLNLRVAIALAELKLPAALTRDVVASAIQDLIAELRPLDSNDWLAMVRTAQSISRERIEDYVASLTASGPLVPDTAAQESR